ncbi:hypothetical protein Acid345_4053 [Candidatus Koribacter versatilis Ellin345]|uniref:AtPDCT1/2 transmembrane domain-containing protein n=1 Tax=Koribacter versatilis (strain Ellin345) TaxID=204669 RepID=Q1IJ97_KORVE|nr:phosphatase PAP2-related protein [Candidatus Koribacter versatilis]ABF43053.1 hypothetical protein Acid345_4053 [Candidatus Koribacter versatilis Ellin345]
MSSAAKLQPVAQKRRFPIVARAAITAAALGVWFWTQSLIGARKLHGEAIGDGIHTLTHRINAYLQGHSATTNALLIVSSAIIDSLGIYLLAKWIFGKSARPFVGLLIVLGLRQLMQGLVALPTPPDDLWHYPGFPSLLVTYGVSNDFFYSGHTSIAVFGATELWREGRAWLRIVAVFVVVFEIATVLILRAHYTMDVYTGLVTALLAAVLADRWTRPSAA